MTWLNWLSHCIFFQIKRGKKLKDQKFILTFAWLFPYLTNQEIIPSSSRGLQNVSLRKSSRTPPLVDSVEQKCEPEVIIELDDFDNFSSVQFSLFNTG